LTVNLATEYADQVKGIDLLVSGSEIPTVGVSVKLAYSQPGMRSFMISRAVATAVIEEPAAEMIAFCDNFHRVTIIDPSDTVRRVVTINMTNRQMWRDHSLLVFYDQLAQGRRLPIFNDC
jgi:hypothetical protein